MRMYPVKLVGASKPGTNLGELNDDGEAEKSRKHLSKHTWPVVPKENQETL